MTHDENQTDDNTGGANFAAAPDAALVADPSRADADTLTSADGAVRQLEKADRAARQSPPPSAPAESGDGGPGEVVPLGKFGGSGAPEEDAADASETPGGGAPDVTRP
jgi:hypothetical protein